MFTIILRYVEYFRVRIKRCRNETGFSANIFRQLRTVLLRQTSAPNEGFLKKLSYETGSFVTSLN